MHKVQDKPVQGSGALKFFEWAYLNGDKEAAALEYVPLPDSVKTLVRKQWDQIKDTSGKAVAYK
jgi:phosphate transport system substrate-binding protein